LKKDVASNSIAKSEYWDLITSTLSSYEVKKISSEGKVKITLVKDDYFLVTDVWNVNYVGKIPDFEEQFKKYKGSSKNIKFSTKNHNIGLELKFVFYHNFFSEEHRLSSLFGPHNTKLIKLVAFLNEKHSRLQSILDLDVDKTEKEWVWWLNNKGIKTIRTLKSVQYGEYQGKTQTASFFRLVHEKLLNLTDTREEWEKNRWDVRVLNANYGVDYNTSGSNYYIDFTTIKNPVFKKYLKKYIKTRLLGGRKFSWGSAVSYVRSVPKFFNFISEIEPDWNNLNGLTRKHIEKYLEYLRHYAKNNLKNKNANSKQHILDNITRVYTFLQDTQRYDYRIAPKKPTVHLLYSEDYPTLDKKSDDDIDYIPDYVLEQLFENIIDLHPDVQPVVWVAFKSGLRISDVLGLTQDCLVRLNGKYSIQTDIKKTYVEGHKIPID
jgi:integrase